MIIAVDFDGTIVKHEYPSIGKEQPFAVETLRQLAADGHKIILWTFRSGDLLEEAVTWCEKRGLHFYAINSNYPPGALFGSKEGASPKIEADVYIDDRNLGGLPDWGTIYTIISGKREEKHRREHHRKKSFWQRLKKAF